jgi:hypothetical protein
VVYEQGKVLSRSDVKELGDLLDQSEAALVVVGEGKLEEALDKAEMSADPHCHFPRRRTA